MKIAIIGAGPAGMAAALQAAWRGQDVTLFERNPMVGRKLLVTGSGRCNISNDGVAAGRYVCADPAWMEALLSRFGVSELKEMLREVGVLTTKTSDGWYYPLSDSAQSVADALFAALKLAGVTLQTNTLVTRIDIQGGLYVLQIIREDITRRETFDRLVVAAGGMAYPNLGSRGELFPVLAQLGHTVFPKRPALSPVLADLKELKSLRGIRLDAGVQVWKDQNLLAEAAGNLIFTEWGLNGPAVMDVSHAISAHPEQKLMISLNLLHFFKVEFAGFLAEKRSTDLPVRNFLEAFFSPKVANLYLQMEYIRESTPFIQLDDDSLNRLIQRLRDTRLPVTGVRGFEFCQVSAGGVPVGEVDAETMESRVVPGLYLVGETVDVVGPCGGYNLHYAFASGALAGMALGI